MREQSKVLVNLLSGIDKPQLFFMVWFAVVGFLLLLFYSYHKKTTQRNFRDPDDPGPKVRVDHRQLKDQNQSGELTVKKERVGIKRSYPTGKQ